MPTKPDFIDYKDLELLDTSELNNKYKNIKNSIRYFSKNGYTNDDPVMVNRIEVLAYIETKLNIPKNKKYILPSYEKAKEIDNNEIPVQNKLPESEMKLINNKIIHSETIKSPNKEEVQKEYIKNLILEITCDNKKHTEEILAEVRHVSENLKEEIVTNLKEELAAAEKRMMSYFDNLVLEQKKHNENSNSRKQKRK